MDFYIKKLTIKNFKIFESITIHPNRKFNIIVGENNSGKSTIFEAILLWKKCYETLIKSNGREFYKASGSPSYISFQDLYFLRIRNDVDLFNGTSRTSEISITISNEEREFELGMKIIKPQTIKNAFYRVRIENQAAFDEFADIFKEEKKKLREAIFIYQTRPVANILQNEPYMNKGQVISKIERGMSQEVLRNKIISKSKDGLLDLENCISDILGYNISFTAPAKRKRENDEFIDLRVLANHKTLELHLQGSGFLQISEIMSTVDYVDAPLNLLFVDEPDSHIHTNLQYPLLQSLKSIENNQIFIISHNDSFVNESEERELFYLNSECKVKGELKALELKDFDLVKKELGGTIIALDKLNVCNKVVFVEGDDDTGYITKVLEKYCQLKNIEFSQNSLVFFNLRGKDYLEKKIDNYKRILSQLFKGKQFLLIYDKDFSTIAENTNLKRRLKNKLGKKSFVFSHDGYCIESGLFSDREILADFLSSTSNLDKDDVSAYVDKFFDKLNHDCMNIKCDVYRNIEKQFNGQKKDSRPELSKVQFNDFIYDACCNDSIKPQFLMNKDMIKSFIRGYNVKFKLDLFPVDKDESSEFYASSLFINYIDFIREEDDLPKSLKALLKQLM